VHSRRITAAVLSLALVCPALASAAPQAWNGTLTRAQAVARVAAAGFDVRTALAQADESAAQVSGARAALLPQISITGESLDANLPQFGMPVARQTYASFSGSLPIVQLAAAAGLRAAHSDSTASAFDLAAVRNDAALAAITLYDNAALAAGILQSREAALADQQANVARTELLVRVGRLPGYESARARAALADAQQSAEDEAAQRDEAFNALKVALDFDLSSALTLGDSLVPRPFGDSEQAALARALAQRPDLLAAAARVASAAAKLSQARAAYVPIVSVSAQTYNGSSSPQLGRVGSQVSVSASVPLFDGGARSALVRQATDESAKAQIAYERGRLTVQADVANAWRELEAARKNLETAQSARENADENLRVARLRQRAGKAIQLEVLDALSLAAGAREMVLRAEARYDLAVAGVRHAAADPQP